MPCSGGGNHLGPGLFWGALLVAGSVAWGAEPELTGRVDLEVLQFPTSPQHAGQDTRRTQPSMKLSPEFYLDWNDGDDSLTVAPILRLDAVDRTRGHADLRELIWLHVDDGWTVRAGVGTIFWGATESRHLVDIVNQTDLVEDPGGEEKLGQPMVNLAYQLEDGEVSLYWLPAFRERTFPGGDGRFRGAVVVDTTRAAFPDGKNAADFAVRYARTLGAWDAGLTYFHGTSREPRAVLGLNANAEVVVVPTYDRIDQVGFDLQGAVGDWLWKMEAIGRKGHVKTFAAFVGGFEYTSYAVFDSNADLGIIAEYLHDGRGVEAPATPYDDDLFLGARLMLNDISDTSLLGGVMVDRVNGGALISLELTTRLSDFVNLEVKAQALRNIAAADPLSAYDHDHNIRIRISRYF